MEWLAILGLAGWSWWQSTRIGALTQRLKELELRGAEPRAQAPASSPVDDREPLLLDQVVPPDALEPLLLDTPLPEASNDDEPLEAPGEAPALLLEPLEEPVRMPPAAATPPPRISVARERKLEQWLSQNGFAWLGGALVGLGGIFLVAFASQQTWFTPQVRLFCAIVFGLALVGASEWARRVGRAQPPGHPLVAAMLAGAGIVTFYATVWAAHGLYELIDFPIAALALTLCALALVALSFLHGQALGVLAVAMAMLVPPFTGTDLWPSLALTFYVGAVGAAGFGLAALRRWSWVAAAAMAGLYFWFAAAISADEVRRALALASFAAMGGVAIAFRRPLPDEAAGRLSWTRVHAHFPAAAIAISSVVLIWTWLSIAPLPSGVVGGPAWVAAMFVALAAAAVRARVAVPLTLTISIASLVLGFAVYLQARFNLPPLGPDFYPFVLFAAVVAALSALGARPHRNSRALIAASGAIGAALLTLLAAFSRDNWHDISAWAPLFISSAMLFAGAWLTAEETQEPRKDRAAAFWVAAAAALLLLGIESAFPASVRTAAHAGAAALFACAFAWRGWGMLRYAALAAATLTIGHALSPNLIGATLAGDIPLGGSLTILATAAALLFGASYMASRVEPRALSSESLSAAAVIVILTGVYLALRWLAAGGAGAPLDGFTEISLRILALMAAGHVLMPRPGGETGLISAWRGHVLMGFGLIYVLGTPGLSLNPWWGLAPASIIGPPLLNTLALAFAAPAALALAASNRLYTHQRLAARIYGATGGVLAVIWAVLELRRAFRGDEMASAPVGLFEGACYALLFLATALTVAVAARMRIARNAERPFTQDLMGVTRGCAWFAIVVATFILLLSRHPWWGAQDAEATYALSTLLAVLAHGVAIVLALFLGRALSRSPAVEPTRFAAAAAALLFGWSFGHAAIRWFYHRGLMDNGDPLVGLEGFAHTLWPLIFVLAAAAIAARAPGRDTVRAYVYDLQAILSSAVWPALVFAGVGLWLLFNPWWGFAPANVTTPLAAINALVAFLLAAWMSWAGLRVPHVRWPAWLQRVATVAVVAHLFVAATLVVRRLYHPADMSTGAIGSVEMWVYSAVWALFGAGVFWLGMRRGDPLLRWIGLGLLLLTTFKVFLFDMARLSGVIRVGSFVGLGLVLLAIAWAARRFAATPPPGPGDLLTIKPSARRERRHGRRQRSS